MLYREIMAVCSQIHTKHINTLCGQNVELLNVEPPGPRKGNTHFSTQWSPICHSSPVCSPDNSNIQIDIN